jgi:hypothetical protein
MDAAATIAGILGMRTNYFSYAVVTSRVYPQRTENYQEDPIREMQARRLNEMRQKDQQIIRILAMHV